MAKALMSSMLVVTGLSTTIFVAVAPPWRDDYTDRGYDLLCVACGYKSVDAPCCYAYQRVRSGDMGAIGKISEPVHAGPNPKGKRLRRKVFPRGECH